MNGPGMRAAARHARRAVPGPLGELAARELSAHADLGYWGSPDALVSQLARQVLALPAPSAPRRAGAVVALRGSPP